MAKTLMGSAPLSAAGMYTCSKASHTSSTSPMDPMSQTVVTPAQYITSHTAVHAMHTQRAAYLLGCGHDLPWCKADAEAKTIV